VLSASRRLAILGGSSPFTLSLFEAFAGSPQPLPFDAISLHGRDAARLEAIRAFGVTRLAERGITLDATTDEAQALSGADLILLQIRFGGLEARERHEAMCQRLGLVMDETLGPMALVTALQIRRELPRTIDAIRAHCPDGLVLNMINPLSLSTALLARAGLRTVGLCELPATTLARLVDASGGDFRDVKYCYSGFNHRGFLHHVLASEKDLVAWVANAEPAIDINGISSRTIAKLDAVPLKYFTLFEENGTFSGRAKFLMDLGNHIMTELAADGTKAPPSLRRRRTDWYDEALVPIMHALAGETMVECFVNLADTTGLVREGPALVSRDGILPIAARFAPPQAICGWLDRFEFHERSMMACMDSPGRATIKAAIDADPAIPGGTSAEIREELADIALAQIAISGHPAW
jgi:6-phospho-beta-glucosidase